MGSLCWGQDPSCARGCAGAGLISPDPASSSPSGARSWSLRGGRAGCAGVSPPMAGPRGDAPGVPFREERVLGTSSTLCFVCPGQESLRDWGQRPGTRRCPNPCRDGARGRDAAARPAAPPVPLPAISGALPRRGASLPRLVGKLGSNRGRDKPAAATGLCRGSLQRDSLTPQPRLNPLPFLRCPYHRERLLLLPRTRFPKPAAGPFNI